MNRRNFITTGVTATAGTLLASPALAGFIGKNQLFKISLAEWSFHKTLFANEMTNLEFPKITGRVEKNCQKRRGNQRIDHVRWRRNGWTS